MLAHRERLAPSTRLPEQPAHRQAQGVRHCKVPQKARATCRMRCPLPPGSGAGLSPIDQLGAGTSNHFSDLGLICLYPENCVLWERHVGFAPVLVDPYLDYSQQVAPISDSVLDDLPLFVGQMRPIASRIAEPAVMLCHLFIVNDVPEIDYPLSPV